MHNYDKTFEHLRDEGVKVDVRRSINLLEWWILQT